MTEIPSISETNLINFMSLLFRREDPDVNESRKAYGLEALDIQRGRISAYKELYPQVVNNLNQEQISLRIDTRRNLVGSRPVNIVDIAINTLEDRMIKLKDGGVFEQLDEIDMSKMTYSDARASVYAIIIKANPNVASELFHEPAGVEGDKKWILQAMREITEAGIASCYANSVIEAEKAKATSLTQTASVDSSKVTSLRVVDADSGSKIAPLTEVPSPSPERKTAASK